MTTKRRSRSRTKRRKGYGAKKYPDRYGEFDNGKQRTPDLIAGTKLWYPREETS